MATLYLCGAGNSEGVRLALRVRDAERRWDRIVLLDDDPATHGGSLLGVEVIGPFDLLADADADRDETVNLVARTTEGRRKAGVRIASFGIPPTGLVAPDVDTLGAALASDVLVYPGAIIGPETTIGAGSVVFMGAVVGHESRVAAGCVIAANAVLNARVVLDEGVYVGANATILPEIEVGARATVGAGSVVVSEVSSETTVMGVPARLLMPAGSEGSAGSGPPAVTADRIEDALTEAWTDVLGVDEVPVDERVFDLGATSLAALEVSERLRRALQLEVSVVDLFRFPTIRGLARHLGSSASTPAAPPPAVARRGAGRGGAAATGGQAPPRSPPEADGRAEMEDDLIAVIIDVFGDVLGRPEVGPDSHFFELGGDSTSAGAACRILESATGETLCFMQVARHPTPRELARHMAGTRGQPPRCAAQGVMNRLIRRHDLPRR